MKINYEGWPDVHPEPRVSFRADSDYEIVSIYSENETKEDRLVWIDVEDFEAEEAAE